MLTKGKKMENPARIGFRLESKDREDFEKICRLENMSVSENLQLIIRKYCSDWRRVNK